MDKELLKLISVLKDSEVSRLVNARISEFSQKRECPGSKIFEELCFCILTANFNAERCIRIQASIGNNFLTLTETMLAKKLKELGHRFPNTRAGYIADARKHKASLKRMISSSRGYELREWLVKNIKGLGYKEASHFLRNIGFENMAIIDFHIVDILARHKLIKKPKSITKGRYIEIESLLSKIAEKSNLNLAELDLYLWYAETGKVLK